MGEQDEAGLKEIRQVVDSLGEVAAQLIGLANLLTRTYLPQSPGPVEGTQLAD